MKIPNLEFAAYFSYTPRPTTEEQRRAKTQTFALKTDAMHKDGLCQSASMVRQMTKNPNKIIQQWFGSRPTLVPIPRSSLTNAGDLWVSERIATAMVQEGLGGKVGSCLKRATSVPKSAYCSPPDRPKTRRHYSSFSVEALTDSNDLVLVDDVVTRGATMLGAANRLADRFPNARIRSFALVRTQSNPLNFTNFVAPVQGTITLYGDETRREP